MVLEEAEVDMAPVALAEVLEVLDVLLVAQAMFTQPILQLIIQVVVY